MRKDITLCEVVGMLVIGMVLAFALALAGNAEIARELERSEAHRAELAEEIDSCYGRLEQLEQDVHVLQEIGYREMGTVRPRPSSQRASD